MELTVEVSYCGALQLPHLAGNCRRLHGHDYRLAVTLTGHPDSKTGAIADFVELQRLVRERVVVALDHQMLNDVIPNPTAERQATWIWHRLKEHLPLLSSIRLWESPEFSVTYCGD